MAPKRQRLILAVLALVAILGAGLLATYALRQQAAYFYTPSEARAAEARNEIQVGAEVRLGGMVQRGSIVRQPDGVTIAFQLADTTATVPVRFTGITPDLFAEGSGAVADGHFDASGTFIARNILAKHDERYVPPQMGQMPSDAAGSLDKAAPAAPATAAPAPSEKAA